MRSRVLAAVLVLACVHADGTAETAPAEVRFARTSERLARGRYLVHAVTNCFGCHATIDWKRTGLPKPGTEGAGGHVPDDTFTFAIYAPNITPDPETGAGTWTDAQLVRVLRQGIGHDGRPLSNYMPFAFYRGLTDGDLASIVVYLRSLPPVRNRVPRTAWPEALRSALFPPPLPPLDAPVPPPPPDPRELGRYLAGIGQCAACHTPLDEKLNPITGMDFAGGTLLPGPWGRVNAANLTPDPSGIPHYDETMFVRTIRTGRVNGVRPLNHVMPWETFRNMTDADLRAIFSWLRTLAPVRHRVSNAELTPPDVLPRVRIAPVHLRCKLRAERRRRRPRIPRRAACLALWKH